MRPQECSAVGVAARTRRSAAEAAGSLRRIRDPARTPFAGGGSASYITFGSRPPFIRLLSDWPGGTQLCASEPRCLV